MKSATPFLRSDIVILLLQTEMCCHDCPLSDAGGEGKDALPPKKRKKKNRNQPPSSSFLSKLAREIKWEKEGLGYKKQGGGGGKQQSSLKAHTESNSEKIKEGN